MPTTLTRRRPTVSAVDYVGSDIADQLWELYYETFAPLEELALLSHLYPRAAFDELLARDSVTKLVCWDGATPVGLAMVTNDLEAVPQISPRFLRRKYPEAGERNAIYFGIMMFVGDRYRRSTLAARLLAGMAQRAAEDRGVMVFDMCRHNVEELGLHDQAERVASWFPNSSFEAIDQQYYFAARFPEPMPAALKGLRPMVVGLDEHITSTATATPVDAEADIELPIAIAV